jgi:hypothetical protein
MEGQEKRPSSREGTEVQSVAIYLLPVSHSQRRYCYMQTVTTSELVSGGFMQRLKFEVSSFSV